MYHSTAIEPSVISPGRPLVPSWVASAVFHLLLLLAIALWLRPRPAAALPEPERRAGIVLAQTDATGQTEFFSDSNTTQSAVASAPAQSGGGAAPSGGALQNDLASLLPTGDSLELGNGPGGDGVGQVNLGPGIGPGRTTGTPSNEGAEYLPAEPQFKNGPKTSLSVFGGAAVEGSRFAFVLDHSKSMGSGGLSILPAAKAELERAIGQLDGRHRFQILVYNHRVEAASQGMVPADDRNKRIATAFLGGVSAASGTSHYRAVLAALRLTPPPDVIFLLTDGDEPHPTGSQLQELNRMNTGPNGGAAIHVLQFGEGTQRDPASFFRQLSAANGGDYRYIDVSRLGR